jgi:uncharacterized protein YndB with AHSA1/START domain
MTSGKNSARAVADVVAGVILASVEIAVPAERVFQALTTSELTEWWGSADTYRTTEYTADLRVGGQWRTRGVGADGKEFSVGGVFREIDPPQRLVQTWVADWDGGNETTITYTLEPVEGGTRVVVRHEGFGERRDSCRGHGHGWERVLDWLETHFEKRDSAESRFFLCRLLPPRPTFMADMNAEELDVMRRHQGYWKALMNEGKVIAYGPVADPKGGWGVGIIRVPTEEAMHALKEADPAILSGRGFSYEVLPMPRAVFPE